MDGLAYAVGVDINGASAVVTGGASGIGAAVARQLAAKGARVVIADLQAEKGEALAKEIGGVFVTVDVTNTEQIIDAVKTAADLGPLRALVNSAGVGWAQRTIGKDGEFESAHNLDLYKKVLDINLVGTFRCIAKSAAGMLTLDPMEDGERGAIVNTASVAAEDGQMGQAAYSASKGGVVGMTLPIARDLASESIRVNTILPGIFDTPLLAGAPQNVRDALGATVLNPKRLGHPAEYANLAMCMIENGYFNGEDVRLDGGIRMAPR